MNQSGACHSTLLSLFDTFAILFDFYHSHALCFVWFLFLVFVFFVDDARKDDSKHDQLSLDVKKTKSNNSSRKEKYSNISSTGNFFVNGSSLINILIHIFP